MGILKDAILVSHFIIFKLLYAVRLIKNNLIMIFNLSTKSLKLGVKRAGTQISHYLLPWKASSCYSFRWKFMKRYLTVLPKTVYRRWLLPSFSHNRLKIAENEARSSRVLTRWSSTEARKRNYHAYGNQLSLYWFDFSKMFYNSIFHPSIWHHLEYFIGR